MKITHNKHIKIKKIVALFISILMLFEGAANLYASELQNNTLQPQILFSNNKAVIALAGKYFISYLGKLEKDPVNLNVPQMKKLVEEELERLKKNENPHSPEIQEEIKMESGEIGAFIINCGSHKIRYFNLALKDALEAPGTEHKVLETRTIGKYLTRQILFQKKADRPSNKEKRPATVNVFKHVEKTSKHIEQITPYLAELAQYLKSLKNKGVVSFYYINGNFAREPVKPG